MIEEYANTVACADLPLIHASCFLPGDERALINQNLFYVHVMRTPIKRPAPSSTDAAARIGIYGCIQAIASFYKDAHSSRDAFHSSSRLVVSHNVDTDSTQTGVNDKPFSTR